MAAGLAGFASAGPASAHRLDAALTLVELAPHGRSVQVTHRLYAHDLEHALDLGAIGMGWFDSEAGRRTIGLYAARRFGLQTDAGAPVVLDYVGAETEGDLLYVYFTGTLEPTPALTVTNRLLHDLSARQINLVNVRRNGQTRSASFPVGSGPVRIEIPQ